MDSRARDSSEWRENNPLAHSALPDAEANIIRNLMGRIDELESEIELGNATKTKKDNQATSSQAIISAPAQSLKDREIIEYLGEDKG